MLLINHHGITKDLGSPNHQIKTPQSRKDNKLHKVVLRHNDRRLQTDLPRAPPALIHLPLRNRGLKSLNIQNCLSQNTLQAKLKSSLITKTKSKVQITEASFLNVDFKE